VKSNLKWLKMLKQMRVSIKKSYLKQMRLYHRLDLSISHLLRLTNHQKLSSLNRSLGINNKNSTIQLQLCKIQSRTTTATFPWTFKTLTALKKKVKSSFCDQVLQSSNMFRSKIQTKKTLRNLLTNVRCWRYCIICLELLLLTAWAIVSKLLGFI
jgi:hypothetical protein